MTVIFKGSLNELGVGCFERNKKPKTVGEYFQRISQQRGFKRVNQKSSCGVGETTSGLEYFGQVVDGHG